MDFLLPEFKLMIRLLQKKEVDFMLIGGYAVIFYGYDRTTGDLDIWLKPTNDNKLKFIGAMRDYGITDEGLKHIDSCDFTQHQMFFFGEKPERMDFITIISNIAFDEAKKCVNYFPLEDKMIPIIQYHHLILSKFTSERAKDKADVEELQKINLKRKKPY